MNPERSTQADIPCTSFDDLVRSRRDWIDRVLHSWCLQASRKDLLKAEAEWQDIAGRVDSKATLWTWAWERFPVLTHPDMTGVNETQEVLVRRHDGTEIRGFPDSRKSVRGVLVLLRRDDLTNSIRDLPPVSIDDIESVTAVPHSD